MAKVRYKRKDVNLPTEDIQNGDIVFVKEGDGILREYNVLSDGGHHMVKGIDAEEQVRLNRLSSEQISKVESITTGDIDKLQNLDSQQETDGKFNNKVDKESGKSLVSNSEIDKLENLKTQSEIDSDIATATSNASANLIPVTGTVLPRGAQIPAYITTTGKAELLGGNNEGGKTFTNTGTTPSTFNVPKGSIGYAYYDKASDSWSLVDVEELPMPTTADIVIEGGEDATSQDAVFKYSQPTSQLSFFRDYHDKIGFFKELYLYGEGLDNNKIYYLRLVVNNDSTYQNGFFIAESDSDFSNSVNVINPINISNANRDGIINFTNSSRNISISAIVDWSVFPEGNTGEVLRLVLSNKVFNRNNSPNAGFNVWQIKTDVDNLNEKAVLSDDDGKIYGSYISRLQLEPSIGESPEDANNYFSSGRGVGVYELLDNPVVFNRVVLPFTRTTNTPVVLKIAVLDSLPSGGFDLSFQTIFEPFVVLTKSYNYISTTGYTTTYNLDEPIKVPVGKYIFFFLSAGGQTVRVANFNTQNTDSTRHNYYYTTSTPDIFESNWNITSGSTFLQTQFTLSIEEDDQGLENRVTALEETKQNKFNPRINIPSVIYAAVGKQLNLYYDALILGLDKGVYSPANCSVQVICNVGFARERNFQYTPVAGDVGDKNLTVNVFDSQKNILSTKTVTLRVIPNTAPLSVKNILLIGDSTLNNGPVAPTIRENFVEIGGNIPIFWGGRGTSPANHFGWPGATFATFATQGANQRFVFAVTSVNSVAINAVYSNNGSQFTVQEVYLEGGSGYIRCSRNSGSNNPNSSGVLTLTNGSGDASISYSSYTIDPANPLWNTSTNQLDVAQYRTALGMGAQLFDVITFRLGINESFGVVKSESDRINVINYAKSLADAFLIDNPSCKIIFELPTTDGNTRGGWGANYGASDYKEYYQLNVWRIRELLVETFDNGAYDANVEVCGTGAMVDRYYGFGRTLTQIADRIPIDEEWHNNAVHPTTVGYYQLADALFPHILKFLQ